MEFNDEDNGMMTPRRSLILNLPQMEETSSPVSPDQDQASTKHNDTFPLHAMVKLLKFKNILLKKTKEAKLRHKKIRAQANKAMMALKAANMMKPHLKQTVQEGEEEYKVSGNLSFYSDENISKASSVSWTCWKSRASTNCIFAES